MARALALLLAGIVLACVATSVTAASVRVDIANGGGFQCTQTNRTLIFHGINAVYKSFPWLPRTDAFNSNDSLVDEDFQLMRSLGINAVRLGVMWPGVEPVRGQYNTTYLTAVNDLITRMGAYGIYTIVDFHQDLLHPALCGEGLPDFALQVANTSCNSSWVAEIGAKIGLCKSLADMQLARDPTTGYPTVEACLAHPFGLFYPTPDVSSAFQSLYTSTDLKAALAQYWQVVAKAVAGNPYVLGLDLFNEPWAGNIWENLEYLWPGASDQLLLQPLYKQLHTAIRAVDDSVIIMYEGTQVPDILPVAGGIVSHNGFSDSPGGSAYNDREALSYHVYCCQSGADVCDANGDPLHDGACNTFNSEKVAYRVADAVAVNRGGAFLTEFGGCADTMACVREITRTASRADKQLQSWAYWQYKYFNDITTQSGPIESLFYANGTLQDIKAKALARTYAQAVQGVPVQMSFDSSGGSFSLTYDADPTIAAPTQIFVHAAYYYPTGYAVNTSVPATVTKQDPYVLINVAVAARVVVTITPTTATHQ